MSSVKNRGTIHGVVRAGGGGGTSDYDELQNRPKINSKVLSGAHSGHYYGLAEIDDILITELNPEIQAGVNYPRLEYIKDKNDNIYNLTYSEFSGRSSGLVPSVLQPSGKVLSDSGIWVNLPTSGLSITNLYTADPDDYNPTNITIPGDYTNYDFILFDFFRTSYNQYHMPAAIYSKDQIRINDNLMLMGWAANNEFVCYKFTTNSTLVKSEQGGWIILLNIYGIKF